MNMMIELGMGALMVLAIVVGLGLKVMGGGMRRIGMRSQVGQVYARDENAYSTLTGKALYKHDVCVMSAENYLAKREAAKKKAAMDKHLAYAAMHGKPMPVKC